MASEYDEIFAAWDPDYMGHLPSFYQDVEEMKALAAAIDPEITGLKNQVRKDFLEGFILNAPADRLKIWEQEIGIIADPSTESLEFRRKRLILRYTTKPPFTIRWLRQQLTEMLGVNFISATRDADIETLFITADIDSVPMMEEINRWLEAVVPLSMDFGKHFIGHRDIPSRVYIGAISPVHIHIEMKA